MSPADDGYFSGSTLLKTTLLTVAFSTVYVYEQKSFTNSASPPFFKPPLTISVIKPVALVKKKKTIYLTFDDGPNAGTKKVMAILKAENVPATFFLIGEHVYGSRDQTEIFDSIKANRQIEIANHSYTHACHNLYSAFYSDPDKVKADFKQCADSLQLTSNIVRTPGRNIWRTSNITSTDIKGSAAAADSLKEQNFVLVGWDVEWHYNKHQQLVQSDSVLVEEINNAFKNSGTKTKNALVLLAHDRTFLSSNDSNSLHNFLKKMKALDLYDFATISAYPELKD